MKKILHSLIPEDTTLLAYGVVVAFILMYYLGGIGEFSNHLIDLR